jgi:DNA primase
LSDSSTLERVARYYEEFLWHSNLGAAGRQFLQARGVPLDQARSWRLGLSPNAATFMTRILEGRGVRREDLCAAGVAKAAGRAGYFELLRGRLVFPHTENGQVVGFTGRLLPGRESSAKYLTTSQTPVFIRSKALFGLDQARSAFAARKPAVIVEGPLDALALYRAGVTGAVALGGVAFSAAVLQSLVAAGAGSLIALFDGDAAGAMAAERVASSSLTHPALPTSIALCPEGRDPDELTAEEIGALVEAAVAAPDFLVSRLPVLVRTDLPVERVVSALGEFFKRFPPDFAFSEAQLGLVSSCLSLPVAELRRFIAEQRAGS